MCSALGVYSCPQGREKSPECLGSQFSLPPLCQPGLPRKASLRLPPLTSVLGHNAGLVPGTPAQGLLGARSQSEALTSQSSPVPLPQWCGDSCCPFGVKYSPIGCGTLVLYSQPGFPFPLWLHSFIQHSFTEHHSGPKPVLGT